MSRIRVVRSRALSELIEFVLLLGIVFLVRTYGFGLYQVPSGSMETTMLKGERFFADKFSYALLTKPQRGDVIAFNEPRYQYSSNPLKRWWQYYVWGPSNWTKRIIGEPGDHIKGVVEDGKPVIYRNGEKLDEPYLNQYPLIAEYKENSTSLVDQIDTMARRGFEQGREEEISFKSFEPNVPWDKQKFYRIDPKRIVMNRLTGEPEMKKPGEPIAPISNSPLPSSGRYYNGTDEFEVRLGQDEYWVMGDNRRYSGDSRFFGPIDRNKTYIHAKILYRIWSIDSDAWFWLFDLIKNPMDFFSRVRWNRFFERIY
jgi:signal peptidase I